MLTPEDIIGDAQMKYCHINTIFPIRELIISSPNTRAKGVPRPLNPFLIFRRYYNKLLFMNGAYENVSKSSKRAAEAWRILSPVEKKSWIELAEISKSIHKGLHPDYKFRPQYGETRTREKTKTQRSPTSKTFRRGQTFNSNEVISFSNERNNTEMTVASQSTFTSEHDIAPENANFLNDNTSNIFATSNPIDGNNLVNTSIIMPEYDLNSFGETNFNFLHIDYNTQYIPAIQQNCLFQILECDF